MIHKLMRIGNVFYWMLLFIPISIILYLTGASKLWIFTASILSIIPIARIMGFTTKDIALQSNPTISGLVSATFGNMIELIIAIIALKEGLIRVVQASIIGSIIGNILLLIGLSLFIGGLRYKHQKFNKEAIGVSSTMLIIVVAGMTIPSVYAFVNPEGQYISSIGSFVAIVMALIYLTGLIFSLRTHKDLFDASDEIRATHDKPIFTKKSAALILFITTILAALESELLVSGIKESALNLGVTETFIGFVLIAIITNIAENSTAINFALENKIDLSLEIGLSSAIQIALFVVPILILVSGIFGYGFLLVFSMFEVISVILAVMIINHLAADGRCNWLEGAQLISVYLILAISFYFI